MSQSLSKEELRDQFEKIACSICQEKRFSEIKGGHVAKDKDDKPVLCPDQFVARIEIDDEKVRFIENYILSENRKKLNENIQKKLSQIPIIALVLESPHEQEYDENNYFQALGAAMGKTGQNINKYLLGNLAKYIKIEDKRDDGAFFKSESLKGEYSLLLINAVQFQCSLGCLSDGEMKNRRDSVFKEFFQKAQTDFIQRLRRRNLRMIINCCTGGEDEKKEGLNKAVQDCIDAKFKKVLKLKGKHPSSAFFCQGFEKV